jgi:hypothetical protein
MNAQAGTMVGGWHAQPQFLRLPTLR